MAKKRNLPAHIVLPNGMWRFVKKGTKKISSIGKSKRVRVKRKRTVSNMVRRRTSRKSSSGGMGLGLGKINMKGLAVGLGAGYLAERVPQVNSIPMGKYLGGAVAGKVLKSGVLSGVLGVVAYDFVKGGLGNTISGNSGVVLY